MHKFITRTPKVAKGNQGSLASKSQHIMLVVHSARGQTNFSAAGTDCEHLLPSSHFSSVNYSCLLIMESKEKGRDSQVICIFVSLIHSMLLVSYYHWCETTWTGFG